jgi:hypothetical protein
MKNAYEVLRQKELEISRLKTEVEALRTVAPLLSDDGEFGNDNESASTRGTAPSQPAAQVPRTVNTFPQPEQSAEWKEKVKGWP